MVTIVMKGREMNRTFSVTVAVLLTAFFAQSASAQSPALTNADIARLVAMRVSDQTVIAVINETDVRQFDLGESAVSDLAVKGVSTAVIAAMRQSSVPAVAPTARPQTLAEAAAEAAQVVHSWPLSTNTASSSHTVAPAPAASTSEGTKSEGAITTTTDVKDEAWWRSHALVFRRTLADDNTKLAAAQTYYDGLPDQARGIIGTPIVTAWMKAKEEIARLDGVVANDKRALADFEEEARRAGVAPGWLREK